MNSSFQQTLKQLSFKTVVCNQVETLDYSDLFANQRTLIFSVTQLRTTCTANHTQSYIDNYEHFISHGIDNVYAVDSTDWLIAPLMDKKTKTIKGLPDRELEFVSSLAEYCNYQKPKFELARFWQYVVIINNGEPEKIWHNPFNASAPLMILKDPTYRYRKLSADVVLKYLVDNTR